jgi:hypothetical protein
MSVKRDAGKMNLYVILALCSTFNIGSDDIVCGVYINPYQASKKTYLENIFNKADSGLINTIVVDLKSDYGFLAYRSKLEQAKKIDAIKPYIDIDYLLDNAESHDVKVIARIVCFRDRYLGADPKYAILDDSGKVWLDAKDLAWTNPYNPEVREYLYSITEEIVALGFKSIAFDYIRFPTDGDLSKICLTQVKGSRYEAILEFLETIDERLGTKAEIGVCCFGFAVWYRLVSEGQDIEKMGEYIDALYPMLYPSHFGWSFKREENEYWRNYWIYFDSVRKAREKLPSRVKVIPFVQGFDLRAQAFNAEYMSAQFYGSLAANADGFLIWNAAGDYSISWSPLLWVRNSIRSRYAQMSLNNHMKEVGQRYLHIGQGLLLTQAKNQKSDPTSRRIHNPIDSLPLEKNRRSYFDPVMP